jgi:hypothetical protein
MFKHSKWLRFVASSLGLAVVAGSALYAAKPQGNMPLYVASVELSILITGPGPFQGGGPSAPNKIYTSAGVRIVDQEGHPVRGARVTGRFTGCDENDTASSRTGDDGLAVIKGPLRKCGCVYTFAVTNVTKSGGAWNPPDPLPSHTRCLCGCE